MKINSIKIAKLYSFGPEQVLEDFKYFNLFIGKNGSGKTNIFRALSGDIIDNFEIVKDNLGQSTFYQHEYFVGSKVETRYLNHFIPWLNHALTNSNTHSSDIKNGALKINYTDYNDQDNNNIIFEEGNQGMVRYTSGDITTLKRCVGVIELPKTEFEFYKDLALFMGSNATVYLPYLNFGLYYIFELHYRFSTNGTFTQGGLHPKGNQEDSTNTLPSGVENVSKILTSLFKTFVDKTIILIDEPELHLEPRVIKRLFQFISWFLVRYKPNKSDVENMLIKVVQDKFDSFFDDEDNSVFGKNELKDSNDYYQKQLFLASHSPVFINEFLTLGDEASIYEFESKVFEFNKLFPELQPLNEYFSTVRKIESNNAHSILDNLGVKGSDILQTNGVIWVEGPSDVIYIRKWLEMHAKEINGIEFVQGSHYEFQMYGGTLLDSLCLIKEDESKKETEHKKLVEMFSFSRNAFVVTDSDAVKKAGKIIDKSKFGIAKKYISDEIKTKNSKGFQLGMWYKEGDMEIKTIEDYLDEESKKITAKTKKLRADSITKTWDGKKISDIKFPHNLKEEIKTLYELIKVWNQ